MFSFRDFILFKIEILKATFVKELTKLPEWGYNCYKSKSALMTCFHGIRTTYCMSLK